MPSLSLPLRTRRWDDAIALLDPVRDAQEITRVLVNHVFPLETLFALEVAQLRTFTIPSISRLLHATREYEANGQRRLDDTRAILTEVFTTPLGSPESRAMVDHLNRIHGLYNISNDDFLYVLSTFVFDPALFLARWGHRPLTANEKSAYYTIYKQLGAMMHIANVPESYEAFYAWRVAYEQRAQRYAPENEAVARGLLNAASAALPARARPLLESLVVVLTDDEPFRAALGLRKPSPVVAAAIQAAIQIWKRTSRFVNAFEHVAMGDTAILRHYPSYPKGYERLRLGPLKVIAMLERRAAAGK